MLGALTFLHLEKSYKAFKVKLLTYTIFDLWKTEPCNALTAKNMEVFLVF